jgi:hypothetical protein
MANYFARKAGNIDAADVWATTPSGTAADVWNTFTTADVLHSNNFAITVNVSTTVGEVRNDNSNSATAGGSFTLSNGVTLTANIFAGSTGTACVQQTGSASGTIVGNSNGGTSANGGHGISKTSTGLLTLTGNLTGGTALAQYGLNMTSGTCDFTGNIAGGNSAGGGTGGASGVQISGGTLNVLSGTVTGGTINGCFGLLVGGAGVLNFTGNATGSSTTGLTTAHGIYHNGTAGLTITGNATGGTPTSGGGNGIFNNSTGGIVVNGTASGGAGLPGVHNASTGTISITRVKGNAYGPGNTFGLAAAVGANNVGLGVIEIQELEYGDFGMSPASGTGIRLKKANTNVAVFNYVDSGSAKTLVDATQGQMPAATDVRDGVSYASGALTGTCKVPAAASVAFGVPVDATTGTAVLTPAAIRSELSVELGRIDAAISSRLAPSGTLATVTNLTNAPASVTPTDIWAHSSRTLTSASGPSAADIRTELDTNSTKLANLDATVSSRLASASYTAPANSDITAIKSKTDALPSDPADQSLLEAAIAAVTAPSATDVATAVRSELATELGKIDALNTDRLAQVSTVATTGSQLAAALS